MQGNCAIVAFRSNIPLTITIYQFGLTSRYVMTLQKPSNEIQRAAGHSKIHGYIRQALTFGGRCLLLVVSTFTDSNVLTPPSDGMEIAEQEYSSPGMGDLPESCIASILRFTTPRDVARLACVNRIFRYASNSDSVWQTMLPPSYEHILAQAPDARARSFSKKEIYDYLCTPVLLENGTQEFWLDRATGGVCRSIGARGLYIVWGENTLYWNWTTREGSRFPEVAYLRIVWWLEVRGHFHCAIPPGTYTLSWRLSGEYRRRGQKLVKFSVEGPDHVHASVEVSLKDADATVSGEGRLQPLWTRDSKKNWVELDVGEFTVGEDLGGDSPVEIQFSMTETDCAFEKHGLFLDSVMICPTAVRAKRHSVMV